MPQTVAAWLVWALVAFLAAATLIPFLRIPHGAVRVFGFPRLQLLGLIALAAVLIPLVAQGGAMWAGEGLLAAAAAVQLAHVAPFTPFWRRQSLDAPPALAAMEGRRISIIASNVKMSNRDYGRLLDMVTRERPDVLLAVETDEGWAEALSALDPLFGERVERILDNGYGMALLSALPVEDADIRELVTDRVPSIRTTLRLPSGERVRLYVVHPEPPVPCHDSQGRDAEIALVGIEAEKDPLPAIVAGDLNDVAWSFTTRRFQRLSGFLDPRRGRGFFNSFDARYPVLRWPLDHLFHDPRFRLVEVRRLESIGSDHFPMLFGLALDGDAAAGEDPGEADVEEKREARREIREEQARDRDPIGEDWEG